ncbi:cysteine dioxygenase family protein [Aeromicrobium sp. YIM 150415]|uniref:cysteine dioxygenase family protein n=1 Tax=Aeromicrobium sp. YIM 150415 TaxID=2803912 RepID=UPI001F062B51|nr:cysteine dioxygenase family protein [Aeromicrobium sp. YIM 150415]
MLATQCPPEIAEFAERCRERIRNTDDEQRLTQEIARDLTQVLDAGFDLPEELRRPQEERYIMYPLYVSEDDDLSIASAVWNVAQGTPVHGHETWGVVGIYSGQETERQYEKPRREGVPLSALDQAVWSPGQVTVCCTIDDDVHQVWNDGDVPCVGIHVYGRDIGRLERRSYDPETGDQSWFVSTWPTDNDEEK